MNNPKKSFSLPLLMNRMGIRGIKVTRKYKLQTNIEYPGIEIALGPINFPIYYIIRFPGRNNKISTSYNQQSQSRCHN